MNPCEGGLPGCWGRNAVPHHRLLRSQGGVDGPTINLCPSCHLKVHSSPARAYATGLLLHAWDSLDTPAHPELWVAWSG